MTTQVKDVERAVRVLGNIDAIERKMKLLRQYINPQTGTLVDSQIVAGLYNGADECMKNIIGDLPQLM